MNVKNFRYMARRPYHRKTTVKRTENDLELKNFNFFRILRFSIGRFRIAIMKRPIQN